MAMASVYLLFEDVLITLVPLPDKMLEPGHRVTLRRSPRRSP
jgi:hypothetical protein